ncbi:MAG: hypothetical protein ABIF08_03035 [Nanoarchaeota archaeon]
MKEILYGLLVLSFTILMGFYFIYIMPETTTFVTILLGSVIAAVGTYIASYRAQKYLQDRSEKKIYTKTVFYPIYRELEANLKRLNDSKRIELTTNIWIFTINSPDFLGLQTNIRTKLERLYEKIKIYNSIMNNPEKEVANREKLAKEITKAMKFLESVMKEK